MFPLILPVSNIRPTNQKFPPDRPVMDKEEEGGCAGAPHGTEHPLESSLP